MNVLETLRSITNENIEDLKLTEFRAAFHEIQRLYRFSLKFTENKKIDFIDRNIIKDFFDRNYPSYKSKNKKRSTSVPRYCLVYLISEYTNMSDVDIFGFIGVNKNRSMCTSARTEVKQKIEVKDDTYMIILDHFNIEVLSV
jgi:chromosomal replication initiation ATPase DnaA